MSRHATLVAAALALAGCSGFDMASLDQGRPVLSKPAAQPRATTQQASLSNSGVVTVGRGDTVYGVSRNYEVPIRALIDMNALRPPYVLRPGQVLQLPKPREIVVTPGETLASLAASYRVDQSAIVRLNDIEPPYTLTPGQRLRLPAAVPPRNGSTPGTNIAVTSVPSAQRIAAAGVSEGAAPIAEVTSAPLEAPAPAAGPPPAVSLRAPTPAPAAPTPPRAKPQRSAELPVDPEPMPPEPDAGAAPEPVQLAQSTPAAVAPARPQPAVTGSAIAAPPARAGSKFLWPVNGTILSAYGPKEGGLHNDGINIAAARGTPVRAAENGVVAYVGNELRGFGNLVLVRHADGWVSAYAHADEILVRPGQQVNRGDVIARVGTSGGLRDPQVHFELRRGKRAVDPRKYLSVS